MAYRITTDTMADLPEEYLRAHKIETISLSYLLDGVHYDKTNSLPSKQFYDRMRAGAAPTTSQFNPEDAIEAFSRLIDQTGEDILHLSFSSGLSGSYNSARVAAEELKGKYPGRKIYVVDSLCASMGQGLLLYKAVQLKENGMEIDALRDYLENTKLNLCHIFTVEDLEYLHRGGRVSKAVAVIGGMLNIKPVLHVDNEGHLVPFDKVRGRRKSLTALVDAMGRQMGAWRDKNDIVFISHGDSEEDARFVASLVRERFGIDQFMINYVGPTIGAHSGPGTIALFFLGEYR